MTDGDATSNPELVSRFARLVQLALDPSAGGLELRDAARSVVEAAKSGTVTFALVEGGLLANGIPVELPEVAARFAAYGVEELGVTPRASQADLLDLARLLAAAPGDGDPVARFASRAAVLDAKALPRRLRARRYTQERPALSEAAAAPAPLVSNADPTAPIAETPSARRTPRALPQPSEADAGPPVPRDAPVRLMRALAIPEATDEALLAAITILEHADEPKRRALGLEQMVTYCDLAFRQGRHEALILGIAALLAIEFAQIEADPSDERRQAFNHAVRRLARPVLLRQLAVLRHARADDLEAVERLQLALYRFGIDGAEAVLDACTTAPDAAAVGHCLECLRGLPRAHEALRTQVGDPNEIMVRQAIAILGALRDTPSELALDDLLEHPDARARRDAVAALSRFDGDGAFESVAFALADESPLVRLRSVTGLASRKDPRLLGLLEPLLKTERDREVLYATVAALGTLGTPEAVHVLIAIAQGQAANPQRDASGLRIQACIALVAIRTPQAMAAVQVLRDDRDREVRQASMRLVAHAKRRPTTQVNAVIAP